MREKNEQIAGEEEIAIFFSDVMRGKPETSGDLQEIKTRMKAGELLTKYHTMCGKKEERPVPEQIEFIGAELLED